MKILSLDISNTKRIEALTLELNGDNLTVAGTTGQGKTTAISALWDIITKTADPLSKGQRKGHLEVVLGDEGQQIRLRRDHKKKGSAISAVLVDGETTEDGEIKDKKLDSKTLKTLLSKLSFNPHKIHDMKPTEQVKLLCSVANMGNFDLEECDKTLATLEEDRTAKSRLAANLDVGAPPENVKKVDVSALYGEKDLANERLRDRQAAEKKISACTHEITLYSGNIDMLDESIENLKKEISLAENRVVAAKEKISAIRDISKETGKFLVDYPEIDTTAIDEKINQAQEINEKAIKWDAYQEGLRRYNGVMNERDGIDQMIRDLRANKKEALDGAQWPVDGLSVEDGRIIFNGCNVAELGESERTVVYCALALKDILAHPAKVVRLDGIESMSAKDFNTIQTMFNDKGIQVLATRVARGDIETGEIEIVDGTLTSS